MCLGDFNIDLLKHEIHSGTNVYYSTFIKLSYLIFLNAIKIQLSDHLYNNIKERNLHFNEREFLEATQNLEISSILQLHKYDSNCSIENMHNRITYLLVEYAPFRKWKRKEIKLKGKPCITKEILHLMW